MSKVKYFVSYASNDGFGRVDIIAEDSINSMEQIDNIEKGIQEKFNIKSVIVLNYIKIGKLRK